MAENISVLVHDKCCGCKACGDICPRSAISYHTDEEGFFYPSINENCIDCGLCRSVCPELNYAVFGLSFDQRFIGCLDKNRVRRDSGSSGGLFGLIADRLLSEGYEITGAAFDDHLQLKHQFASDKAGIEKLKKSKYLQSDCSSIYAAIKSKLKSGKKVMFVGTPCQCSALLGFVGKLAENMVVVDFACHGVPSQDLFDKCIAHYEYLHDCKVIGYSFRHKTKRYGSPQNFLLNIKKGDKTYKKTGRYYEEPFYCGFQKYITLRPSCYSCQWARTERISDITLADFWGIESVTNKWDRTDHPSLIILNTDKGRELFDTIKPEVDWIEVAKEDAIQGNRSLIGPTRMSPQRAALFADYNSLPFNEVVQKHLTIKGKWKKDVYYSIPFSLRKVMLNILKKIKHA